MVKDKKPTLTPDALADAAKAISRFRDSVLREAEQLTQAHRRMQSAFAPSSEMMARAQSFREQVRAITEEQTKLSAHIRNAVAATKQDFSKQTQTMAAFEKLLEPARGFERLLGPRLDLNSLIGPKIKFDDLVAATRVDFDKLVGSRVNFENLLRTQVQTDRLFKTIQATLNDSRPQLAELRERLTAAVTAPVDVLAAPGTPGPQNVAKPNSAHGLRSIEGDSHHRDLAWNKWLRDLPAALQLFVLMLVFMVLQPLVDAAWSQLVARWLEADRRQDQQAIISETNNYFGADAAKSLRCVRARTLRVREDASTDSAVIGRVKLSQSVEVVEVRGGWSLIRYRDQPSGQIQEGWAASSFLVVFSC